MKRLFTYLAAISVALILAAVSGVHWLTNDEVVSARHAAAEAQAKSIAIVISGQINALERVLNKMSEDPAVIAALTSRDKAQLAVAAANLEKYFPDIMKFRLLLPGISDVDKDTSPRMGFADLEMVKETFNNAQLPSILGDNPDRHLAMTQQVFNSNKVIGVILASIKPDLVDKIIKKNQVNGVAIEVKQDKIALGIIGGELDKAGLKTAQLPVAGTGWQLNYWYSGSANLTNSIFFTLLIALPVFLCLLAFFSGHRRLSVWLSQDVSTIMKAFKDVMGNNSQSNYPIKLSEMDVVIPTLIQFKRVLDSTDLILPENEEFELNGFFGESSADEKSEKVINNDPISINKKQPVAQTPAPAPEKKSAGFDSIFRAYDIRGIVNKSLTDKHVYDIGLAIGSMASKKGIKTIVLARDGRTSSPTLADAMARGLVATGRDVMDIGMVPSPVLYFVAQHIEGRSGVMITGSHNPAEYNGIKIVLGGETLAGEQIQQIKQIIDAQIFSLSSPGEISQNNDFIDEYIGIITEDIRLDRPMKVAMDCGNGVTGKLGPILLKALGCEVVELFTDIDGTFPNHHPDPSKPENMADLIGAVKFYNADVGVAFDGDGDRLGVVDSGGKIIWADRQMMLFAKDVLANKPGSEIIYDVKCSRQLGFQIKKFGGRGTMWKTGHSYMKAKLKETGAKLAGELSGHIFFNDRWFGFDDAMYAAARLLEILARDSRSSAEVFADFPDCINTPELIVNMAEGENFTFIKALTAAAKFNNAKLTTVDGLRVDFAEGWGLVRASNTTPSLVLRFEADTHDAMIEIQDQFRTLMIKIKPDIVLPF
jgi:phosphomannomutase/phosphoglucomutase